MGSGTAGRTLSDMPQTLIPSVTDARFASDVLESEQPVLVDFTAAWCPPCKALAPILDELADEYAGSLRVVKVDVDENPSTARRFDVRSMPTLVLLRDGAEVKRLIGARPKRVLLEDLADVV